MPNLRSRERLALLALVAFSMGAISACALEPEPTSTDALRPRIELTIDAGGEAVPVDPPWSTAASLTEKRINHTMTALGSGKVIITGGNNFAAVGTTDLAIATTEIRDPATGTWGPAAPMTSPRLGHTATLLGNGKLLVVGGTVSGNQTGALASAELYDPATNTWAAVPSIAVARYGHEAAAVGPGKVLILGGIDGSADMLASAELYDSATNTWTAVPAMATARATFTLTALADGKLLVAGGKAKTLSSIASAELYDPATNTWTATAPLHTSRYWHTATLLESGKVLVAGGSNASDPVLSGGLKTTEIYDPLTGAWSPGAPLATERGDKHTATRLANGGVLLTGGEPVPGTTAELYDPSADAWIDAGTLALNRDYSTASLLDDGSVLLAGGVSTGDSRICERYTSGATGSPCTTPVECQSGSCISGACAAAPTSSASSGGGGSGGAGGATSTAVGASSTTAGAGGGASAQGGGDKVSACSVGGVAGRPSSSAGPWVALGVMIALRRRKVAIDSATASKRPA